jgi:hypothetical protein
MDYRQETDQLQEFILLFGTAALSLAFIMHPCKTASKNTGLSYLFNYIYFFSCISDHEQTRWYSAYLTG